MLKFSRVFLIAVNRRDFFLSSAAVASPLAVAAFLPACKSSGSGSSNKARSWEAKLGAIPKTKLSPTDMYRQANVKTSILPKGRVGRKYHRPMTARYITIHSTQNYTGDAWAHSKALHKGALRGGRTGYLCWHFTVQEDVAIQHLPTNEEGEHADFDGPGNRQSIGIEMCEHRGNDLLETLERTAKLAASLMYYHKIPVRNVVPHYHWPRKGYTPANKNCPHFLLENGRPGATWNWFVSRIDRHHQRIKA